jgi:hypothetical protein
MATGNASQWQENIQNMSSGIDSLAGTTSRAQVTVAGSLTANNDNTLTFSATARLIRIQNESGGTIYWNTDAAASTGTPSIVAPAANAVSVEWIEVACSALHIFIPSGGTTALNTSGGVKVSAWT